MSHIHFHSLNRRAILVPIFVSLILIIAKTYGWIVTDSLAILSSLLDSTLDLVISILNLSAIIYAAKPPDDDHRFGHNSIEDIVGLIQATAIFASGMFLLYEATNRFINPAPINQPDIGIIVMAGSLLAALFIVIWQKLTIRKTKSVVVESDMLHYLSDFLMNGAIIISLVVGSTTNYYVIDPILATCIAAYIMLAALKIGKRSFNGLMDKELDEEEKEIIREILKKDKDILGWHALKTRRSGSRVFVQMHVDMSKKISFQKSHDIVDRLEEKIASEWQEAEIIIHTDPV